MMITMMMVMMIMATTMMMMMMTIKRPKAAYVLATGFYYGDTMSLEEDTVVCVTMKLPQALQGDDHKDDDGELILRWTLIIAHHQATQDMF
jgi:hypothetical protein